MYASRVRNVPPLCVRIVRHHGLPLNNRMSRCGATVPLRSASQHPAVAASSHVVQQESPVIAAFHALTQQRQLHAHDAQSVAIAQLAKLYDSLLVYARERREAAIVASALELKEDAAAGSNGGTGVPPHLHGVTAVPRGAYILGSVGTGKTMLMNLFFDCLQRAHVAPVRMERVLSVARDVRRRQRHAAATSNDGAAGQASPAIAELPLHEEEVLHARFANATSGGGSTPTAVPGVPSLRAHAHEWMTDIHTRIQKVKRTQVATLGRSRHVDRRPERDAINIVARDMAVRYACVCLDEFSVHDVADAMILARFGATLMHHGCVLVLTSNTHPQALYEGGLNREYFLPFISTLQRMTRLVRVDTNVDFRMLAAATHSARSHPHRPVRSIRNVLDLHELMRTAADDLRADDSGDAAAHLASAVHAPQQAQLRSVRVAHGRDFAFPAVAVAARAAAPLQACARIVAVCTFASLCATPRSADDFFALAAATRAVVVTDVPVLTRGHADAARRFVNLIDLLYDARVRLYMHTTAATVDDILAQLRENEPERETDNVVAAPRTAVGAVAWDVGMRALSLACVRALSRLHEMATDSYQEQCEAMDALQDATRANGGGEGADKRSAPTP